MGFNHWRSVYSVLLISLVSLSIGAAETPNKWLPASAEKLPRWRGFNLLEKFQMPAGRKPFVEDDFRLIARLGFNFVRLPMDYRFWIKDGNWEQFDEKTLAEIDQAVEWGNKYGIHVCINFHRAPGYTVAKPPEKLSLWTDSEAQRVCALHWATFARRYKGIPSERLSFNLMNEPSNVEAKVYLPVVKLLVEAIRKEDPQRLIISDGLKWGQEPIPELREMRVAQATRGYKPGEITHYKANWVNSKNYPIPRWPKPLPIPGTLLAPTKPEGATVIAIDGPFEKETAVRVRVFNVSSAATLVVEADGKGVFEKAFKCGPGEGEWKKAELIEKYKSYRNIYDKDYTATIPAGTKRATVRVTAGDWLHVNEIGLKPAGAAGEDIVPTEHKFGQKPAPFRYAAGSANGPLVMPMQDRQWLWKTAVEPWKAVEVQGVGVFVGEWGCYNRTPHDIVLRWAEDCLANWKQAGWGWAMWNFRGPFGVLDSGREDVKYEEFEGHKLDRKLLELLLKY